jgi:protein-serine/threonine kinase
VVSRRCQDLIRSIIQEKEHRLCCKRYKTKEHLSTSRRNQDHAGHCVFPNDAEEIKAHKWFRDIPWDRIHTMTPPFVPNIKSMDDTHYFDEEDSISDFSVSATHVPPPTEDIAEALKKLNRELQILARGFVERPYDSIKLRKVEKEIEAFNVSDKQKNYLKEFVKRYGRKEKKRPRDRLLRDRELASKVLELRKRGAFLGYTHKRIRKTNISIGQAEGSGMDGGIASINLGKRNGRHRARLSIH